jgi:hypothetical protein
MRRVVGVLLLAGVLSACGDDDSGEDPEDSKLSVTSSPSDVVATQIDGGPVGVADVGGEAWTVLVDKDPGGQRPATTRGHA